MGERKFSVRGVSNALQVALFWGVFWVRVFNYDRVKQLQVHIQWRHRIGVRLQRVILKDTYGAAVGFIIQIFTTYH